MTLLVTLAASAGAQRMQLELRPRANDTLRMRLDQTIEVTGTRKGVVMKPVVTSLHMFSRAIVESSGQAESMILAVTDSVDVSSSDEHATALATQTERELKGRQMRLRLAPDGTVGMANRGTDVPKEVNDLVSVMPASFPRDPVEVGGTWAREMPITSATTFGAPITGIVKAIFRLDSVSRAGDLAYVSMRGAVEPPPQLPAEQAMSGSVDGEIVVNRKRGWLSETRFLVHMSTSIPTLGEARAPMQFRTKITQHMRVLDRR